MLSATVFSQTDTIPGYKKSPYIPSFNIQLADSSWYAKSNLQQKPTLIMYFNPDCGHCQLETEDIISKINKLKGLQIVMITSREVPEVKQFIDHYLLQKFPNVIVGSDTKRFVSHFYDVKFTPFSALYDKNGNLVKIYESGIDFVEMERLITEA